MMSYRNSILFRSLFREYTLVYKVLSSIYPANHKIQSYSSSNLHAQPQMEDRAMSSEVKSKDAKLTSASPRDYDIIIYGATGFTGSLCALHVAKTYGTSIKWAIAGTYMMLVVMLYV